MKAPWHHLCERIKDLKKKEQEVTACCSFCTSKFNTHVLKSKNSRETSSSPWTDESGRQQTQCVTNLPKRGSTGKEEGATFAEKAWREGRGHILRRCVSVVGQLSRTGSCWEVGPLGATDPGQRINLLTVWAPFCWMYPHCRIHTELSQKLRHNHEEKPQPLPSVGEARDDSN